MKPINSFAVAVAGMAISIVTSQAQISLNYSSTPGATIQFNGAASTFQFDASTLPGYVGSQWSIGNENGGSAAIGLFGAVNNGPFSYGPITTSTMTVPGFGLITIQTANVTGPLGGLSINDGSGYSLTGDVNWFQIDTVNSIGGINASLTVNVNDLAYGGTNPDLNTFVADGPGSMNLSFQFSPGMMLSDLSTGTGPFITTYSGSISVPGPVPEPASVGILLLGFGALVCFQRFAKRQSS